MLPETGALLPETGALLRSHHQADTNENSAEADLVSQRIAEFLESKAFCLAPEMLMRIHSYLFQDLDASVYHPGQFKTERMVKTRAGPQRRQRALRRPAHLRHVDQSGHFR